MKKHLLSFILLTFICSWTYSQMPQIDTNFTNFGTFNKTINDAVVLPDNKIIVVGQFTKYRLKNQNYIARLNPDGTLDPTYAQGIGPDDRIDCLIRQADGKILIGGWFTKFNNITRNHIARLNADGTLDPSFDPLLGPDYAIASIKLLSNGKILITGSFNNYNGTPINGLALLNTDGTLDPSFTSGFNTFEGPSQIAIQPDNKIILAGDFSKYSNTSVPKVIRINSNGTLDNTFNSSSISIDRLRSISLQSDGMVLVAGDFSGMPVPDLIRLNSNGTKDDSFIPALNSMDNIEYVKVDPNGQILVHGSIVSLSTKLVRLNSNGTMDNSFQKKSVNGNISQLLIKSDGSILIAGYFIDIEYIGIQHLALVNSSGIINTQFNASKTQLPSYVYTSCMGTDNKIYIGGDNRGNPVSATPGLVRLNTDGTTDLSYNTGTGPDGGLLCMQLQNDNKLIIGGYFFKYNGTNRSNIARINPNGSLDLTFNPGTGTNGSVGTIAMQPDGKVIIAGNFTTFNGTSRAGIARLNLDGSLDPTFNPGTGANAVIWKIVLQPDGKILVGGNFTTFNGTTTNRLVRLNNDGTVDNTFNPGTGANALVTSICLQANKKIIVGGDFTSFNGVSKNAIVRLNWDGSLENEFNTGTGYRFGRIENVVFLPEGKILVGGVSSFNATSVNDILLLNHDGTINSSVIAGVDGVTRSITIGNNGEAYMGGDLNTLSFDTKGTSISFSDKETVAINNLIKINNIASVESFKNKIKGVVYKDNNTDCTLEPGDTFMPYYVLKATPGNYYGSSDVNGNYEILVDSGSQKYTIAPILNPLQQESTSLLCNPSQDINVTGSKTEACCLNFGNQLKSCTSLTVTVESTRRRRCFRNNTFVNYCNIGSIQSNNTEVRVELPEYIKPISSNPQWSSIEGNTLIYSIGTIQGGACGKIIIVDSVVCNIPEISGLTQCTKATITSENSCRPDNSLWDKSDIIVSGICVNQNAEFIIKNQGIGNMESSSTYRVYINDTLVSLKTYNLNSNEFIKIALPSNGRTLRVEADQTSNYPLKSHPRAVIYGCGGTDINSQSLNSVPMDDERSDVSFSCLPIVDSFDPNDKTSLPKGITADNYIKNTDQLHYTLRFQNTGSDTAYTVIIRDTLDINLDISTLEMGVSSNDYSVDISGKGNPVLTFNFKNILLPPNSKNQINSNGFIKYSIKPKSQLVEGTVLKNKAYIYFDYNLPIITNEVNHTIYNYSISDFTKEKNLVVTSTVSQEEGWFSIHPNPTSGDVYIPNLDKSKKYTFVVYSLNGTESFKGEIQDNKIFIDLPNGLYFYQINSSSNESFKGKLMIK